MTERLLQFIWQFQYFNKGDLATTAGYQVEVLFPGHFNINQGPDFTDAKIRIAGTLWAGSVELHLLTSDWIKHGHQHDGNYNNVILHVVLEDDSRIQNREKDLPVLELKGRVSSLLSERYGELMCSSSLIPCGKLIAGVKAITWKSWKDRLVVERLERKTQTVISCLEQNNYHWEETFWWLIARNFGARVNAEAFESIARSLPVSILARHRNQPLQLEALLMGQAGLLEARFRDSYPQLLQKEYRFLRKKYGLNSPGNPVFFLRMRPVNFPTIRLAQLAMLVHISSSLFSRLRETTDATAARKYFEVTANDYWHYHYRFDDDASFLEKNLGRGMIDSIMINTVVPVLFAYGCYHQLQTYKDRAVLWLEGTDPESNRITKGFELLGIENKSAFDSQALTELNNNYCYNKNCLACAIGNAVLKG